jgi:hypothetical protein|nr:MAG TPA: hypothetical protein [Caudoviricetes sp.]
MKRFGEYAAEFVETVGGYWGPKTTCIWLILGMVSSAAIILSIVAALILKIEGVS